MKSALDTSLDGVIAAITAPGGPLGVGTADLRGTSLPVFGAAPPSLREFFATFFAANAAKEFLVFGEERLSFRRQGAKSESVSAGRSNCRPPCAHSLGRRVGGVPMAPQAPSPW